MAAGRWVLQLPLFTSGWPAAERPATVLLGEETGWRGERPPISRVKWCVSVAQDSDQGVGVKQRLTCAWELTCAEGVAMFSLS